MGHVEPNIGREESSVLPFHASYICRERERVRQSSPLQGYIGCRTEIASFRHRFGDSNVSRSAVTTRHRPTTGRVSLGLEDPSLLLGSGLPRNRHFGFPLDWALRLVIPYDRTKRPLTLDVAVWTIWGRSEQSSGLCPDQADIEEIEGQGVYPPPWWITSGQAVENGN